LSISSTNTYQLLVLTFLTVEGELGGLVFLVGYLFRLPFEIRLQIYHYCIVLPAKRVIEVGRPRFNTSWPFVDYTVLI
jgi:hypothetical protein